jgi:type II secretory pathway predicted ATPase ExeA
VTGEPGSGKTTTCRKVVSGLHSGLFRVIYTPLSTGNVMDLYKFRSIRTEITRLCQEAKTRPVIVIDEAHHLRSDVLEDLRLTNYAMDSDNRMCLLLIGQAELRRRLRMAVHEAFNQRVVVRHHHVGLTVDEVGPYLAHLLRLAGTELPLFEDAALQAIHQATSGALRMVNAYAHHSLNAAALAGAKTVTIDHVQAAATEAL